MRIVYLRKDFDTYSRKISLDMAYLVTHKKIRMRKELFEDGLYLPFKPERNDSKIEKYFLTKDKVKKEDVDHYFFDFPFKENQVENIAV